MSALKKTKVMHCKRNSNEYAGIHFTKSLLHFQDLGTSLYPTKAPLYLLFTTAIAGFRSCKWITMSGLAETECSANFSRCI